MNRFKTCVAFALSTLVLGCGDGSTPADEATPERAPARVGFEILERLPNGHIRAWVNTGNITLDQFNALELPSTWFKNQPRESGGQGGPGAGGISSRFLSSPDLAEGEFTVQEHFGHQWFHAATVIEIGVPIGGDGLLFAARVKKFHEYTVQPGTPILLLVSPEGDAYFRNGRDATRMVDDPMLPDSWRLVDYTPSDTLTIELFDSNLVIRTDNEDSFQGPVPSLQGRISRRTDARSECPRGHAFA